MDTSELLFQSILDRLDRIEDKIDKHISTDSSNFRKGLDTARKWFFPILCLYLAISGKSDNREVKYQSIRAVASSTYVAAQRYDSLQRYFPQ